MANPLIDPSLAESSDGPTLVAVSVNSEYRRTTAAHQHARGQLLGASRGLLSVGTESSRWVVPAVHCVWLPPHHRHSMRSHGPFAGWSVYVAETACVDLPDRPCIVRTSGLLREAVARAANWAHGPWQPSQVHLGAVILDEIRTLPRELFNLPLPTDPRLVKISRAFLDDLSDSRRLDGWAVWAGVSRRTITRRFPLETGYSFTEWRQRARLMRALEMLAAEMPVTTIALDLGYETVGAFIALFRRTFSVTPTKYFASLADNGLGD
jgi:AraC-like DNA-binding protein